MYYNINEFLEVNKNQNKEFEQKALDCCNWFENEQLANKMSNKLKILFILDAFTEDDNKIDWMNYSQPKYFIGYDKINDILTINSTYVYPSPCEVYFSNKETCKRIIRLIGDKIIKLYKENKINGNETISKTTIITETYDINSNLISKKTRETFIDINKALDELENIKKQNNKLIQEINEYKKSLKTMYKLP